MAFHLTFEEFARKYASLARDEFLKRFPEPILLIDLEGLVSVPDNVKETKGPPTAAALTQFTPGHDDRLKNVVVAPLLKSGRNDKRSAILVGRSNTNDIVLPHGCISKLHAVIKKDVGAGKYTLTDAESRYGTQVDGKILPPGETVTLFNKVEVVFSRYVRATLFLPKDFFNHMHLMLHKGLESEGEGP